MGGLVAGRATRDALFLTHFPATSLPPVVIASAVLAMIGAAGISRWLAHTEPVRAVPIVFGVYGAVFLGEWALLAQAPRLVAAMLYLHVTALAPVAISGFWSVVSERFDPYTAKRNVSRLAGAGALAGVLGAVSAERVVSLAGVGWTLCMLAGLAFAAIPAIASIGSPPQTLPRGDSSAPPGGSRIALLARHPLLGPMALIMVLGASLDAFVDYALKASAAEAFPETQDLVRFFAAFYVFSGLLAFALQAGLGSRILRWLGIGSALAALPLGVIGAGAIAVFSGQLAAVVAVRGVEAVTSSGLFRSSFELLYTPLAPSLRRSVKAWIDVSARGAGSVVGGSLVLFLVFVDPSLGAESVITLAILTAAAMLVFIRLVHRAYVRELSATIRSGNLDLTSYEIEDATTARTIAQSNHKVDRHSLLEQARALAENRRDETHRQAEIADGPGVREPMLPVSSEQATRSASAIASAIPEAVLERVEELASNDPLRVRRALNIRDDTPGRIVDRQLVAHVIPLLGQPALARDADTFLRRNAHRISGQLVDTLLDRAASAPVRASVADILSAVADRRSLDGLWRALEDPNRELRETCANATVRLVERHGEIAPSEAAVHARVQWEFEWARERSDGEPDAWPPEALVAHVFSLLALLHGRETMRSTYVSLRSGNQSMRGTALEFLESVLPKALGSQVLSLVDRDLRES